VRRTRFAFLGLAAGTLWAWASEGEDGQERIEVTVKTRDMSAIADAVVAHKYDCPGVGTALEEQGGVRVELIEYDVPG